MANPKFFIKQDDTGPALLFTLDPVTDITGASVNFVMYAADGTEKVDRAATIVTAASGVVRWDPEAADTDTAGDYSGHFRVTMADASIETFPNKGWIDVTVHAKAPSTAV